MVQIYICVHYQYREGNGIADTLANLEVQNKSFKKFFCLSDLPNKARGALILEEGGLPYIRRWVLVINSPYISFPLLGPSFWDISQN